MQLSGHKNVQSITNYSSLNLNQQKNMSSILSGTSQTQMTTSTTSTGESAASTSKTPMKFFEGAVISGGQSVRFRSTLLPPRLRFKPRAQSLKPKGSGREFELWSQTLINLLHILASHAFKRRIGKLI